METDRPDKVATFDSLFTTNHMQILKILLASMDPAVQRHLAVYIKIRELQYTLFFYQNTPFAELPIRTDSNNITGVFDEIIPLCTASEKDKMQNFRNIWQNLQNMQEILQFMQMMQEISPDIFSSDPEGGNSGFSGIEELLQLFSENLT